MVIHKCDICNKEMAVWLKIDIDIESRYAQASIAELLPFKGTIELCKKCFMNKYVLVKKGNNNEEYTIFIR